MSNCLNCGAEVVQVEGRRERKFCDNNNKCKGEYNRKQNKAPKYVQFKSFQELQAKFEAAIKEREEFRHKLDILDNLHKNGVATVEEVNNLIKPQNKPVLAPEIKKTTKEPTPTKTGNPVAEKQASDTLANTLDNSKTDVMPEGMSVTEKIMWIRNQKSKK